jgi:hypothetical protein
MAAGSFLGALVGTYSSQMLKKIDLEHQTEQDDRKNRISYLQAAIGSGKLTPDAMNAAIDELGEITSGGGKGKDEHLDILKKLIGKVAHPPQPTPFEQRVPGEGGSRPQSFGEIPAATRQATAEAAAQTPGNVDASKMGLGSVPTPPKRKIYKTDRDREDEAIAFDKRREQEITGPADERRAKAEDERQKAREDAAQERAEANQRALDLRLKNQQSFQLSLERLKQSAADNRERMRNANEVRSMDRKAGDVLDKQNMTERQKNITSTLNDLQKQLTQATNVWKAKEAEAANMRKQAEANPVHQALGLGVDWSKLPDVQAAKEDIDNAKAALAYFNDHKTAVAQGKEDMDEITAKTEDILRNGQPEWSRAAWSEANSGKDAEKASIAAMKQGFKVVP